VPLAVPALAALLAVFIAVPAAVSWFARPAAGQFWATQAMALAGGWVLADLARQFIATGFPWNPLGSVWAAPGWFGDVMLQPAALVSVHGLTLATVVLACAPLMRWRGRTLCLAVLVAWTGYGVNRSTEPPPPDQKIRVVLVQGNVPQGQKWDRALAASVFERYLSLTEEGLREAGPVGGPGGGPGGEPGGEPEPAVVVWPETASPYQLGTDRAARAAIIAASHGVPVLAGAVRFDEQDRPRNSLFAIVAGGVAADNGDGRIAGIYDKWHLVPFGEYQPDWIPIGIQVVPGGGFARGPGPVTLHIPGVPPVGPLICYEAIFPGQAVDESDRPDWMVNATNDAWFGTSTGPRQHLAAARLRAVEEGLPLLRAANTGITAGFDSRGHEITRIEMERAGFRTVTLPGKLPRTVFARLGLWLPGALAAGMLGLGLAMGRRRPSG
jgi:apolipoprotein N-acyltransferase